MWSSNLITVRPCCESTVQYRNQIVASYLLLYVWDKLLYVWDMFPYVLDVQAHLKFRMKHTSQFRMKHTTQLRMKEITPSGSKLVLVVSQLPHTSTTVPGTEPNYSKKTTRLMKLIILLPTWANGT